MKTRIIPITSLRDTNKVDQMINDDPSPIVVTKNGYADFVIIGKDEYDETEELGKKPTKVAYLPKEQSVFDGFVRVRAATIEVEVCAVSHNLSEIKKKIDAAINDEVDLICFHELSLCGYTAGDMLHNSKLQSDCLVAMKDLKAYTRGKKIYVVIGAPIAKEDALYNCAVHIYDGKILGIAPKEYLPNYGEFYEKRHFRKPLDHNDTIVIAKEKIPFGTRLIFVNESCVDMAIASEICEDAWVNESPSSRHSKAGARIIVNPSASDEVDEKASYRRNLLSVLSSKEKAAYVYADAGLGESTTDVVYAGHNMIYENGTCLSDSGLFNGKDATADIDIELLGASRKRSNYFSDRGREGYWFIGFDMPMKNKNSILRPLSTYPFLPDDGKMNLERVSSIMAIQSNGLAKRLKTIHQDKAVLGLSGGLDSTLALLVTVEAFKTLGYDLKNILAVTLPAFGTSKRTHDNAVLLANSLGVSFKEINIGDSVMTHLRDIEHNPENHNIAYENAQARERTQVLMDLANDMNALMIGTGDLSELVLGWCTFNGDHMSNYGVNGSVPKTLVRYLCVGYAELHPECKEALFDIADTPISPELLPTKDGEIAQITEDKVGPYRLHDFFIYHFFNHGYGPRKLYRFAVHAFKGIYDEPTIKKWLREFFRRFFNSQFKRSTLPDGVKVTTVSISPRGDWRMPSDASSADYLAEIDSL